jgi:hypothetical protein
MLVDLDRRIKVLSPETSSQKSAEYLSDLRGEPVVILLGDPGLGKTTALQREANVAGGLFLTIRKFGLRNDEEIPSGLPLFLDGLDEHRADGSPRDKIDTLVRRLKRLAPPQIRMSCRVHDWFGGSDLQAVEELRPERPPVIAQLMPLDEDDIGSILKSLNIADVDEFKRQAHRIGIDGWLENPQTLSLIVKSVLGKGTWPQTRRDLYQQASEVLSREENDERRTTTTLDIATADILDIAGGICAVHLISAQPIATARARPVSQTITLSALKAISDQTVLSVALESRIFEVDSDGIALPQHRTTGEFLAAQYLARRVTQGLLPLTRVIALITSPDGAIPSELRGLYAWLPVFLPADRVLDLHRLDPYSVLAYGDARSLPPSIRKETMDAISSIEDPWFRKRFASEPGLASLITDDLEVDLRALLTNKSASIHARTLVTDAIAASRGPSTFVADLKRLVLDPAENSWLRSEALEALFSVVEPAQYLSVFRTLYERLGEQAPEEPAARLRISIVARLWPDNINAEDVWQVLLDWKSRHSPENVLGYLRPLERSLERAPRLDLFNPKIISQIRKREGPGHGTEEERVLLSAARSFIRSAEPLTGEILARVIRCVSKSDAISERDFSALIQERISSRPDLGIEWLEAMLATVEPKNWWWVIADRTLCSLLDDDVARPVFLHLTRLIQQETDPERAAQMVETVKTAIQRSGWKDQVLFAELVRSMRKNQHLAEDEEYFSCAINPRDEERRQKMRDRATSDERKRQSLIAQLMKVESGIRDATNADALSFLAYVYSQESEDAADTSKLDKIGRIYGPVLADAMTEGFKNLLAQGGGFTLSQLETAKVDNSYPRVIFSPIAAIHLLGDEARPALHSNTELTIVALANASWASGQEASKQVRDLAIDVLRTGSDASIDTLVQFWRKMAPHLQSTPSGWHEISQDRACDDLLRKLLPRLLSTGCNFHEYALTSFLQHGLRVLSSSELLSIAEDNLADETLSKSGRILWLTTAWIFDPASYEATLAEVLEHDIASWRGVLQLVTGGEREAAGDAPVVLSIERLSFLLEMAGKVSSPKSGFPEDDVPEGFFSRSVQRISSDLSPAATAVFAKLEQNPHLSAWKDYVRHYKAEQRRARSDAEFLRPSPDALVAALSHRAPANSGDLRALVEHALSEIAAYIRHGDADTWQRFWNVDSFTRATETRPEEAARDELLDLLRRYLSPLGVSCEREGDMANHKRCDIKVSYRSFIVPIEIKKQSHGALWTAPLDQLDSLYANDPRATGQGIYLVVWYGAHGPTVTSPPRPQSPPQDPARLRDMLIKALPEDARHRLGIVVLDVSIPPSAKVTAIIGR